MVKSSVGVFTATHTEDLMKTLTTLNAQRATTSLPCCPLTAARFIWRV
jgi:hypothetical protein